jgi:thiamine pyrophosphate-dependent acetolactate synthase large subunit-like protein
VVVDIDGDGSFLMNCQEMATAAIEKLDIKMFILNNQHLGMVVQWEDRFYKVRVLRTAQHAWSPAQHIIFHQGISTSIYPETPRVL